MIEQIKSNNERINSIIEKIVLKLDQKKIKTIGFENGKPYITTIPKKVLELEAKKIYMIYQAEFVDLVEDKDLAEDKNIKITSYLSDEPDAHGFGSEVTFASGTSDFLSKMDSSFVGKEDRIKGLTENEKVENRLTTRDYITHLYLSKKQDIDFFLDALPHELMHCFGFKGGSIFEGVTETFTRETAQKYGIRTAPFAHQDETKLVQRIEKIIGRDNLSKYSYFPNGDSNTLALSNCIDSHMKPEQEGTLASYENLDNELFELDKNGSDEEVRRTVKKRLDTMYIGLNETYDDYIDQNQDSAYKLGQRNIPLDEKKGNAQQVKLGQVLDLQNKELEFLEYIYSEMSNIRDNVTNENNKTQKDLEIR